MRVWLARDPKVLWMADTLASQRCFMNWLTNPMQRHCDKSAYEHVTRDVLVTICVTGLLQVWGVAREQGYREEDDLLVSRCDIESISAIAGVPGFGQSMADVGWLVEERKGITRFPKFFEQKKSPSDRFAVSGAQRQRAYRERLKNQSDETVTKSVTARDVTRDEKVTKSDARVEKRRDREETTKAPVVETQLEVSLSQGVQGEKEKKSTEQEEGKTEQKKPQEARPRPKKKPESREVPVRVALPADFALTTEMLQWGADNAPGLDLVYVTGKFRNRSIESGRLSQDWPLAWRNYVLEAVERKPVNGNGHARPAELYKPDDSMDLDKIYPNLRKGGE